MVDAVADRRAEEVMDERVAVFDAQGRVVGAAPPQSHPQSRNSTGKASVFPLSATSTTTDTSC